MTEPTLSELKDSFLRLGIEPPPEYIWLIEHRTMGFDAFTQFEPWHFCSPPEIKPLSQRWPTLQLKRNLIPFARLQGSDDLACFEFEQNKLKQICQVHYDLGPPVYLEISSEHPDLWAWLRTAVDDIKFWFEIYMKRK